jgi:hypothetical protein
MNRGDFILSNVRDCIAGDELFTVLKVWNDQPKLKQIEVYPYIIKDTMRVDFLMEDSTFMQGNHFIDVGLLIRWKSAKDIAGQGTQTETANDIVSRIETELAGADLPASTTDGARVIRLQGWAVTDWDGYFDDGRDYSEMVGIVTAHLTTT